MSDIVSFILFFSRPWSLTLTVFIVLSLAHYKHFQNIHTMCLAFQSHQNLLILINGVSQIYTLYYLKWIYLLLKPFVYILHLNFYHRCKVYKIYIRFPRIFIKVIIYFIMSFECLKYITYFIYSLLALIKY